MTSPYSMLENFKARFICDDATGFLLLLFISIFKKIFYERSLPLQSCEGRSPTINGWGMFTIFLDYKLKEQGKPLIKIDKWFPSTKKVFELRNREEYAIIRTHLPMFLWVCGRT